MNAKHLALASMSVFLVAACSSTNGGTSDGGSPDGGTSDGGPPDGGSSGVLGFTPSNFDPGQLDLTGLGDVDCTAPGGGITTETPPLLSCGDQSKAKFTVITQPNNIKVGVWAARSWRIEPNAVLSIDTLHGGSFPLILLATDSIEILGGLDASGHTDHAAAGGYSGTPNTQAGSGPGAGGASGTDNAGGGGSYCGTGGTGAAVNTGTIAMGGAAYGTPAIVPLVGGSAGGGGDLSSGAGGGAVQLVAANSVTIEAGGYVNVGGGGGGAGAGGGGGSGGSLLIEAATVKVAGTLAANGGGGGSCGTGNPGADGLASNQPAAGGTNGTQWGGNGSAGATTSGSPGTSTNMIPTCRGGGGGGAGRIRINTKSGSAALTGGTLSPDPTSACTTQGQLH